MKEIIKKGATDVTIGVFIQDSASTTGAGKTGLAYNTASLTAYYWRPGSSPAAITLATQTVNGAHADGGFVEVDATNLPGAYRLDLPDAVLASGVNKVYVMLKGATDMAPLPIEISLVAYDPQDAAALGLTKFGDIEADTQDIQGRLPAALSSGNMKVDVFAMQSNVMTAAAAASDLTTELQNGLATAAALTTVGDNVLLVKAKSDLIPSDPADASDIVGLFNALTAHGNATWATATGFSTHSAADVWAAGTRTLTAGTNIVLAKGTGVTGFNDLSAAQVNAEVDTAIADVGLTTTITGRIDAAISTRLASAGYTAPLDAAAMRTALGLAAANLDTQFGAIPDAVHDEAVDGAYTFRQSTRLQNAVLLGKVSGAGDGTETFRDINDTKNRVTATVDESGNRSSITLDGA